MIANAKNNHPDVSDERTARDAAAEESRERSPRMQRLQSILKQTDKYRHHLSEREVLRQIADVRGET